MATRQWSPQRTVAIAAGRSGGRYLVSRPVGRIAVLTGNGRLFEQVRECFARDGSTCEAYRDEVAMVRALKGESFDLILLDIDCTRSCTGAVLRWLDCHSTFPVPILALGCSADRDRMFDVLEAGISDLVLGPIDKDELHLRAHLALKRSRRERNADLQPEVLEVGPYRLDRVGHLLTFRDEPLPLTAREFALAWLFFSNPNVMFNRRQIACSVWGNEADIVGRTLEQHIYKLRKKLRLGEAGGVRLRTCYSLGYKLDVGAPDECTDAAEAAEMRREEGGGWRPVAQFDARGRDGLLARWEGIR